MATFLNNEHEIELFDLYQEVIDAYIRKINQPRDIIRILFYTSHDSQVLMCIFDQESYKKFKDHVSTIPQSTPVRLGYRYSITESNVSHKVLVVKSGVNNKVHEVPIIQNWSYMLEIIEFFIPKYFFPWHFSYDSPDHHFKFNNSNSWDEFYRFATHEDNQHQRYFEVSAGKGSIEEQIFMCRRDYVEKVLPLMQQHQVVFLDESLPEKEKLEKMVALTKQMADLRTDRERHEKIEQHLREVLRLQKILADESTWSKLYNLEQTFIKEVDEGDWNGNGTYWCHDIVKYYNTDSTEMIPILQKELLRKE